jgi:hypothetical protein
MPQDFVDDLEQELRGLAQSLAEPHQAECLLCFTARAIREFDCDTTLRWATRFRQLRAPHAKALERRLGRIGGYCDCEIFLNGYQLRNEHLAVDPQTGEHLDPVELLPCLGVRRGSTQGCGLWERRFRGW